MGRQLDWSGGGIPTSDTEGGVLCREVTLEVGGYCSKGEGRLVWVDWEEVSTRPNWPSDEFTVGPPCEAGLDPLESQVCVRLVQTKQVGSKSVGRRGNVRSGSKKGKKGEIYARQKGEASGPDGSRTVVRGGRNLDGIGVEVAEDGR